MQQIVSVRNRARFVPPSSAAPVVARERLDGLYAEATGRILRVIAPPGLRQVDAGRPVGRRPRRATSGGSTSSASTTTRSCSRRRSARALAVERIGSRRAWREPSKAPRGSTRSSPRSGCSPRRLERPFVLVLDDVHHVDSADSRGGDRCRRRAPARAPRTVVLSGRVAPRPGHAGPPPAAPGGRGRHRRPPRARRHRDRRAPAVDGRAARARGAQPAVRPLRRVGGGPPPGRARAPRRGRALVDVPDHVGDATFVVDYLRSEWTGQLSPEDRQFLCEVACLQRFTGEMCDEILGRTQSLARLRRMHREELLVLPLDQRDEWFRMHPLLTRWLSADLQETDPERWRTIHAAAAGLVAGARRHRPRLRARHRQRRPGRGRGAWSPSTASATSTAGHARHRPPMAGGVPARPHAPSAGLCAVNALDALQAGDGARALHWYEQLERVLAGAPSIRRRSHASPRRGAAHHPRPRAGRRSAPGRRGGVPRRWRTICGPRWRSTPPAVCGSWPATTGPPRPSKAPRSWRRSTSMWVHQANCTSALGASWPTSPATATPAAETAGGPPSC